MNPKILGGINMKKLIVLLALAAILGLAACAQPEVAILADEGTVVSGEFVADNPLAGTSINVFNWGDFIDPAVLRIFEAETGIEVFYSTYGSNEEMYTRLTAGGALFDVLVPSDYMIERLISEEWLMRIDWDQIPNYHYINPNFKYLDFDPNNLYSVPYKWGTFGILYNTTMVDQVVDSWSILWDPQFAGQIFMYDIARDTFGVAQKLLGFSLNSTDHDELRQARDLLLEQRPLVRAFLQDEVKDMLINREGALGVVFSGCAVWSIAHNPELNYVVPKEGTQLWFDAMVIPYNAPNPEGAKAFINFMSRPDIALRNTLYTGFATTNSGAFDLLPYELQNCTISWPSEEVLAMSEVFTDIGPFRAYMERYWIEVLRGR